MAGAWEQAWSRIDGLARFGMQPGLERMEALLERLGHPERCFRSIQVAGTNGKGSTAFALASVLEGVGHPCGLFVSPHVCHPAERVRVRGLPLGEESLQQAWARLEPHLEAVKPSYFEVLTALALEAFAQARVEFAVLECGLGARLDATSAVAPVLSLLTQVGADHLAILGPTLADVARDKAHAAPVGGTLLSAVEEAELAELVRQVAEGRGARVLRCAEAPPVLAFQEVEGAPPVLQLQSGGPRLHLPVDTRSWREAAAMALQALALLPDHCSHAAPVEIRLDAAHWPGRFQVLGTRPPRVLDVAHNPPALERLVEELGRHFPGQRFHVLLAGMADKDLAGNVRALRPVMAACRVLVPEGHARAAGRDQWAMVEREADCLLRVVSRQEVVALKEAVARGDGREDAWALEPLLVCGSFLAVSAWLGDGELPPGL